MRRILAFNPALLEHLKNSGEFDAYKLFYEQLIESNYNNSLSAISANLSAARNTSLVKLSHDIQIAIAYGFIDKGKASLYISNISANLNDENLFNFIFNDIYQENGKLSDSITNVE